MKRLTMALWLASVATGCAGGIVPIKTENLEYHVLPKLEATEVFKESDSARYGPIRILRLHEAGKRDFVLDIHPRDYGLEPVDSTASYVFNVRVKYVMQGSRPAESYEIRSISRNGKKIYP